MLEASPDGSQLTSMTLVDRLRRHDPVAWRKMAALYGPLVYAWVRLSGLNEHDSADVMQEVFIAVHKDLDKFKKERPTDRFRDWLWTITRRRACDYQRKLSRQPSAIGGTDAHQRMQELPENLLDVDNSSLAGAESGLVRRALELVRVEFSDHVWQACLQTAVEGRKPADVAADLGMAVGAVYVARSRVLKRLREELGDLL
jgi:RNA polymerase sigma-70 factor (ECF subfamily)